MKPIDEHKVITAAEAIELSKQFDSECNEAIGAGKEIIMRYITHAIESGNKVTSLYFENEEPDMNHDQLKIVKWSLERWLNDLGYHTIWNTIDNNHTYRLRVSWNEDLKK